MKIKIKVSHKNFVIESKVFEIDDEKVKDFLDSLESTNSISFDDVNDNYVIIKEGLYKKCVVTVEEVLEELQS